MILKNVEAELINKKGRKKLKVKHAVKMENDLMYNVFSLFPPNGLPTLENGEELIIKYTLEDE